MPEPILTAERFTYRYPDRPEPALRELTLGLEPGSFTVVCGLSGSGKSTLLRVACGLVPHFHGGDAAGELFVGGLSLREHGAGDLAGVCGTVLQDPETQVVMGSPRAEIAVPLEHRGESRGAVARAVEEAALALGIAHLLDRRSDTLSGGELQRVALAAALAPRPPLLVLDEPTSQLDPVAGDELVWLLRRLNEEWGTAVLLAEHRLERCLPAADRVLAMERGRVACDASPDSFLRWAEEHEQALSTPAARLFALAGFGPPPQSVKRARAALRGAGLDGGAAPGDDEAERGPRRGRSRFGRRRRARDDEHAPALVLRGVWLEIPDGPAILSGIELSLAPGERAVLMGRNGAGKSTLLRVAKGLAEPTRGRVDRAGDVALLVQSPGDLLIHEHAEDEAGRAALDAAGIAGRERANPRDLSGGERQRLALEVVLERPPRAPPPVAVLLDEPTRGMDRAWKDALADRLRRLASEGAAVLVATHDIEFAAGFAARAILMGGGEVVADGPASEVLAGGWHFSTDVARVLDGAALTPEDGADVLRRELVAREGAAQ